MENSYYGKLDDAKPIESVAIQMIDEQIKITLDKQSERFHQEVDLIVTQFRKDMFNEIKMIQKNVKELCLRVSVIEKGKKLAENNEKNEKDELKKFVDKKLSTKGNLKCLKTL